MNANKFGINKDFVLSEAELKTIVEGDWTNVCKRFEISKEQAIVTYIQLLLDHKNTLYDSNGNYIKGEITKIADKYFYSKHTKSGQLLYE